MPDKQVPLDDGEWLRDHAYDFGLDPKRYLSAERCAEIGFGPPSPAQQSLDVAEPETLTP